MGKRMIKNWSSRRVGNGGGEVEGEEE